MNRQNIVSVRFSDREIKELEKAARFLERSRSDVIRLIFRQFYIQNVEAKPKEAEHAERAS